MKNIEKLLQFAKPPVPKIPDDFSEQLMLRIEKEKVAILPAVANRFNRIKVILGISALLLATLLFSYNAYELRNNGSLELLFFGTQFLGDFIGYLPWDLIVPSLVLAAFSTWMLNKSNILKKGIAVTAIITYLLTGIGGAAIASTGINERIEDGISNNEEDFPWLGMFHHHRAKEFINHPNFKMGKVEAILNGKARVITPHGEQVTISLPVNTKIQEGQILRISGQGDKQLFAAQRVHVCNPNRVMRYFGGMGGHPEMMNMMKGKSCCSRGMMER